MPFTEEQQKEYIEYGGDRCPYCNGHRCFTGNSSGSPGGPPELYYDKECMECGKEWIEVMGIVRIEEVPEESKDAPQT